MSIELRLLQRQVFSVSFLVFFTLFVVFFSQAAERGEPPGVFCQWQQQRQRQRCRGQQDRDQPGHTAVPRGMQSFQQPVLLSCTRCMFVTLMMSLTYTLFVARASRARLCRTGTRRRRTRTRWMTAGGSGGCSGGCRRRPEWRWLWLDPWPACRWKWRGKSNCTDVHLWPTWLVIETKRTWNRDLNTNIFLYWLVFESVFFFRERDNPGQWNLWRWGGIKKKWKRNTVR